MAVVSPMMPAPRTTIGRGWEPGRVGAAVGMVDMMVVCGPLRVWKCDVCLLQTSDEWGALGGAL